MKMKKALLLLYFFASINTSFACINEYGTLLSGEVVFSEANSGKLWIGKIDSLELKARSEKLLANYKRSDSIEYYSDYAAALMYLGQYQEAKLIYQEIEASFPDLYTTASNLGTVYELLGKPDSALFWIKRSVELNPNSHFGSEWIHLKILEFKLSGSSDFSKSILGLNFGNAKTPSNPMGYNLEELKTHIWHQLRERLRFIRSPNKIVGNIYFDLGNTIAQEINVQTALESYAAAKEFGFESKLMEQRVLEMEKLALKAVPSQSVENIKEFIGGNFNTLFWLGTLIFFVLLFFPIRRFWKKMKNKKKT